MTGANQVEVLSLKVKPECMYSYNSNSRSCLVLTGESNLHGLYSTDSCALLSNLNTIAILWKVKEHF